MAKEIHRKGVKSSDTESFSPGTAHSADPIIVDDVSRRGFLKLAGFSLSGAFLASCSRAPVEHAVPYLKQPEELIPGRALFYATTCQACPAACGMLAKTIDGRPIKLEGNPQHPLSQGGLCAVGQASLLGLYDTLRLRRPLVGGEESNWEEVDSQIRRRLAEIERRGGAIRFLIPTIVSPTERELLDRFLQRFEDSRLVEFDLLSSSAILEAHLQTHGVRAVPHYRFDQATVILGFDADFLGTWISPVEFSADYRKGRQPESAAERFSFHAQFESRMSITGANADQRILATPDSMALILGQLVQLLASRSDWPVAGQAPPALDLDPALLERLAEQLWQARGQSLIVCGSQDLACQLLCNALNEMLGNYGKTLDIQSPSRQQAGSDQRLLTLLEELKRGAVEALFLARINPVHGLPDGGDLAAALSQVGLVVDFTEREDETAELAGFVCPLPHNLESWGDAQPMDSVVSLCQPAIHPFGDARSITECLSSWMGEPKTALQILKERWRERVYPASSTELEFEAFWDRSLHDGFAIVAAAGESVLDFQTEALSFQPPAVAQGQDLILVAYPKAGILDGRHSYNAWTQELPDPISKVTWGNYACLSPATARRLELQEGDVVRLSGSDGEVELPVYVQPGQHDRVVAVALGYGTKTSQRFSRVGPQWFEAGSSVGEDGRVGANVSVLLGYENGLLQLAGSSVELVPTGAHSQLASTQNHHEIEVPEHLRLANREPRPIVQQTTLTAFTAGTPLHHGHHPSEQLWPEDHEYPEHHWGLAIDLEACTGCAACVVACQVENNVPVVGKDEVQRNREMHWIRVDRYYTHFDGKLEVAFQPMMCAQCDHAPCETVCPVLATVHSEEGLNQQVYNRCVGTRYCANNCPYKMRRFNWFDYVKQDPAANLVLNPNVTVRSRGVMEKCTFCVQRIQEARLESRSKSRPLVDGHIQPACQQSCPTQAIVFGDMNDPESRISHLMNSSRAYRVLEELNVRPSVTYLALVRNRAEEEGEQHG